MKKILGYFDWNQTICSDCAERFQVEITDFSTLEENIDFQCDYCGDIFPQLLPTEEEVNAMETWWNTRVLRKTREDNEEYQRDDDTMEEWWNVLILRDRRV